MYLANVHTEMYNCGKTAKERLLLKFMDEIVGNCATKRSFPGVFASL